MTRLRQESSGGQAGFPEFWEVMRRCRGRYSNSRKVAETAWDKRVENGAVESDMILGAKGFMAHNEEENVEPQFVWAAAVFLNQELDEQYVSIAREIEEAEAATLLERRRRYWKYRWRDEAEGDDDDNDWSIYDPAVKEAYDMGRQAARDETQGPALRVVK